MLESEASLQYSQGWASWVIKRIHCECFRVNGLNYCVECVHDRLASKDPTTEKVPAVPLRDHTFNVERGLKYL